MAVNLQTNEKCCNNDTHLNLLLCCGREVTSGFLFSLLESMKQLTVDNLANVNVQLVSEEPVPDVDKMTDLLNGVYSDEDEWNMWQKRGDPVLHVELTKWADLLLIAPLGAGLLGKLITGICDNLLTCTVRAWNLAKPIILCPAMAPEILAHPRTAKQLSILKLWGYIVMKSDGQSYVNGRPGNQTKEICSYTAADFEEIIQTVNHHLCRK